MSDKKLLKIIEISQEAVDIVEKEDKRENDRVMSQLLTERQKFDESNLPGTHNSLNNKGSISNQKEGSTLIFSEFNGSNFVHKAYLNGEISDKQFSEHIEMISRTNIQYVFQKNHIECMMNIFKKAHEDIKVNPDKKIEIVKTCVEHADFVSNAFKKHADFINNELKNQ